MASLRPLDWRGTATALLLSALWGANPVAVKIGLADAPPLRLAFLRFVLGGLVILAYAWWTRHPGVFRVRPGEWRVVISLGLIFSVQIGTMNVGIGLTTAAHSAVLLNSYAVHSVVLAHFMIPGDRLTPAKVGGVLIAYAGIVLLFARDFSLASETLVGDLVVSASAVLLAERIVYMARAIQRFDPIKLLVFQSAIGSAAFLLASLALESGTPTHASAALAASLFYQGAVVAGFNFIVNSYLYKVYLASAIATCSLTTPLFGVFIAAAVTGDQLSPMLLLSSLMVAAGIGLTVRPLDRCASAR
ncbi:MAG TPA: DMT family transporter [Candidatus Deferrimicrobiaceae bacterium]|nr:DMT family transporter [Candidatus Deferrimicrobiaceae bacterium]